jgi:hypothetical protein
LNGTLFCERNDAKAALEREMGDLQRRLSPYFDSVVLNAVVSAPKTASFDAEDPLTDSDRRVDLRV